MDFGGNRGARVWFWVAIPRVGKQRMGEEGEVAAERDAGMRAEIFGLFIFYFFISFSFYLM